ncbi:MAG: CHAT domain-containing protein [Blastocatellia bacterium]
MVEDELIDDYTTEALSPHERKLFETNFYLSDERQQHLALVRELVCEAAAQNEEVGNVWTMRSFLAHLWPPIYLMPKWGIAAGAMLALVLAIGSWWLWRSDSDMEKGIRLLSKICSEEQPLEARVSGLACAPRPVTRGNEPDTLDSTELDEAAVLLHKAAREKGDASSLHALGQLYLVKREFDKARTQFERAIQLAPDDASLHANLGVALMEKSKISLKAGARQQWAMELGQGLDELNRAIDLDGGLLTAYFNRALCRQMLGLNKQAQQGWKEYLEKDASSPWADEARRHLKALEEKIGHSLQRKEQLFDNFMEAYGARDDEKGWEVFKAARSRSGNTITERLIAKWAEQEPQEGEQHLQALAWIAEIERRRVGDAYTTDLAAYYREFGARNRPVLKLAREAMAQGTDHYDKQNLTAAVAALTRASALFQKAGDFCEASFAQSWVGYCQTRLLAVEVSLPRFNKLTRLYHSKGYKSLLAYALHSMADAFTGRDDWSASIDAAKLASEVGGEVEDKLVGQRARNTIALVNWVLGRYEEALAAGIESIELASKLEIDYKQVYSFYASTIRNLTSLDYHYAARDVQQEAHNLAMQSGWPGMKSSAYIGLGMASSALGLHEEALKHAELALHEADSLTDEKTKDTQLAAALFYRGHFLRRLGRHQEAVACYQRAISLYEKNEFRFFAYKSLEGSFLALVALEDYAAAGTALRDASALLDAFRQKIVEEDRRNSFFDTEQEFYDSAIEFEWTRQRSLTEAFHFSESSRARSLLTAQRRTARSLNQKAEGDLLARSDTHPLDLTEIQQNLPENARILHYAVLPDKVVMWVIGREFFNGTTSEIDTESLARKIASFVNLALGQMEGAEQKDAIQARNQMAKELYDLLIRPIKEHLDGKHLIGIVPDKSLNMLPFAALISRETGKFFIEEQEFVISPSSTTFITCSELARRKEVGGERFLGVGNPQLDLTDAGGEVKEIASLYHAKSLLVGDQARESLFRSLAPTADVIHLASHGIVDERSPLLSRLLLAPDAQAASTGAGDGNLHAYELYELGPLRARLAVLAACQTGRGRSWRGEGVMNLARPFISAGVPTVLVTLWDVNSAESAKLMVQFHRHRKRGGMDASAALRAAQLDCLRKQAYSGGHDQTWAAFVATGGALPET